MRIVFSPHIDDAWLSLGGAIAAWRAANEKVIVVNIFSISNYTAAGFGDVTEVTARRKAEERANAAATGVRPIFLHFRDVAIRYAWLDHEHYPTTIDWSKDSALLVRLKSSIRELLDRGAVHYFPLAVGQHVDHLLVREAVAKLDKKRTFALAFYEDLPYAAKGGALPKEFIEENVLKPQLVEIDLATKLGLVKSYVSQFEASWPGLLERHASSLEPGKVCERIWER